MKMKAAMIGAAALLSASAAIATVSAETAPSKPAVDLMGAAAGSYVSEAGHRYISFSYDHQGLSYPHLRWRDWTGALQWNPKDPTKSSIKVDIVTASIDTGVDKFDEHMKSADLFDVANFPSATFVSTKIERTGDTTGKITGELTIKGVTKPVVLDARINGAKFAPNRADPTKGKYKLGFSATTAIKRSDFNMGYAVPFVGDDVSIVIEAEFESATEIKTPKPKK
ncbi:MAG: YceI family protein [Parvularculaceae bacterium]|nr:YceI family protein [Parvularculaceae bacterium]